MARVRAAGARRRPRGLRAAHRRPRLHARRVPPVLADPDGGAGPVREVRPRGRRRLRERLADLLRRARLAHLHRAHGRRHRHRDVVRARGRAAAQRGRRRQPAGDGARLVPGLPPRAAGGPHRRGRPAVLGRRHGPDEQHAREPGLGTGGGHGLPSRRVPGRHVPLLLGVRCLLGAGVGRRPPPGGPRPRSRRWPRLRGDGARRRLGLRPGRRRRQRGRHRPGRVPRRRAARSQHARPGQPLRRAAPRGPRRRRALPPADGHHGDRRALRPRLRTRRRLPRPPALVAGRPARGRLPVRLQGPRRLSRRPHLHRRPAHRAARRRHRRGEHPRAGVDGPDRRPPVRPQRGPGPARAVRRRDRPARRRRDLRRCVRRPLARREPRRDGRHHRVDLPRHGRRGLRRRTGRRGPQPATGRERLPLGDRGRPAGPVPPLPRGDPRRGHRAAVRHRTGRGP